jgi:hypothetical protein
MNTQLKLGLFVLFVAFAASSAGCCWHERGYARYAHRYHRHHHWDGEYYSVYPR